MEKSKPHQERARLRLSRTPAFYRTFVADFAKSGLTRAQYCRKHRVGESTFRQYQQDFKKGSSTPKPSDKQAHPRMLRLLPAPSQAATPHLFEIEFVNGTLLRLAHLDASTLAALRPLLLEGTP